MRILLILCVVLGAIEASAQGFTTLAGFGAGGLDGSGFGDPIANDYRGIDWGYDFQTGMMINGYNASRAAGFANLMQQQQQNTRTYMNKLQWAQEIRNREQQKREERRIKNKGGGQ